MKTTIILCLALCGAALALFQPLTVQAQDPAPYFKNSDGRVILLVDANPGGNARNEQCPVKFGGKTAQLNIPSFKINGQLWDLMGSLVQVYYAKYTLGDRLLIPVTSDNMATMDTMTNAPGGVAFIDIRRKLDGSQTVELTEESVTWHPTLGVQNHYELKVPSDLFDKIAFSSVFHMEINFERGGWGCRVSRGYAGILGKAGEWGWDVPGSPEWEKAFADMNHDQATNYWQTLKTENHNVFAKVSDLSIYLGDFMAALGSDNPEIADKLSTALSVYPQNILTDLPEAGLADLQKAAGDLVVASASGKPLTDGLRTAAAQATAQALNGSPQMKEMAERLNAVLKLATTDGNVNSLGMKFVPVPGTTVKFCIWDVRVKDYRAYAEANSGVDESWKNPGFNQGDDHPVVNVSWNDAKAFCAWLSRKDGKTYRLPTENEWKSAFNEQNYGYHFDEHNRQDGDRWPPPHGYGNFNQSLGLDDFEYTSPVGSFQANKYGLYDMVGNVSQLLEEVVNGGTDVSACGASWKITEHGYGLIMAPYGGLALNRRENDLGFRVVLESK